MPMTGMKPLTSCSTSSIVQIFNFPIRQRATACVFQADCCQCDVSKLKAKIEVSIRKLLEEKGPRFRSERIRVRERRTKARHSKAAGEIQSSVVVEMRANLRLTSADEKGSNKWLRPSRQDFHFPLPFAGSGAVLK